MCGLSERETIVDTEEGIQRERSEAAAERTAIDGEIAILKRECEADTEQLLSREALLIALSSAEERLERQEHELRTVMRTKDYLSAAAEGVRERYLAVAMESFAKYSGRLRIGSGKPEMATDFSTSVADGLGTRSTEYYNRAARDAYRFAARLAIIDTLYKNEDPFILLDDPFAAFDDERCKLALELLSELGEERQAIYFTCSESRVTDGSRRLRGKKA
jgi:DNA repair exonuclease SbcCD ATPase subunit